MTKKRVAMWFLREDYDAIRRHVPDEPELPETFDQWEHAADKQIEELKALGITVRKAVIDPKQFATYCAACGINKDIESLRMFAVVVDRKNYERGA
jgi:hypothetical protein